MATNNDTNIIPVETLRENQVYRRTTLPNPYPDPETWNTNFEAGMAAYPRRKENYERFLAAKKSINLDYMPVRLDVENVSRCNFRCTMCQVSDWGPTFQRGRDMSVTEFKKLVDEQYGVIEIKLQGMGEPLLGRDNFFEMIRYARSKHIWVRSTNNGSLLNFRDNYKKLIDSGINEVQISFDGATKETFEGIRHGSKFELVRDNCRLLNDYCDQLGLLRTRMWVLLQQANFGEFFDFIDQAQRMGFKRLTFALSLSEWGQEEWARTNRAVTVEDGITPEVALKGIELGKERGVEVTFWNITEKYNTKSPDTLCRWPFERAYVSSDMRVVPCCMIANPDVSDLGDAKDLTSVWNSESYREFRRDHLEGRIPAVCQGCYVSEE